MRSGSLPWLPPNRLGGFLLALTTLFTVCAAAAESTPAALVAAGDIADCDTAGAAATAELLDYLPGQILALGDLAYESGSESELRECYDPTWGRHKQRTWPVPGNHDYDSPGAEPYYAYWRERAGPPGKGYYSFDYGGWHIIALNSNLTNDAGREQLRWLREDLAAADEPCVLAFWHHPPFTSGSRGDNTKVHDLFRVLYDAGASVTLTGHDHHYERFAPMDPEGRPDPGRGIRTFVVGTGGGELKESRSWRRLLGIDPTYREGSEAYDNTTWGVLILTLHPDHYDWEFIPVPGSDFTDNGSGRCTKRPPQE